MKRTLFLVLVILAVAVTGYAYQTTDTVMLTVTPSFVISVNISSDTTALGNTYVGSTVTFIIGDVINDGNVATYWGKQVADTAMGWTNANGAQPGTNTFGLLVVTAANEAIPDTMDLTDATVAYTGAHIGGDEGDSHILKLGDLTTAGVNYWAKTTVSRLSEYGTPAACGPYVKATTRDLYASLLMPTDVSGAGANAQTITLSVYAASTATP